MKVIRDLTSSEIDRPTVLTWGVYDGLHIGHRAIMAKVVERAKSLQATPTVVTFDPHPRAVLRPETAPPLLQTFDQRLEELERLGIEQTIIINFTKEFASTSADAFLRAFIFGRFEALEVYIGEGVGFGRNREGRFETVVQVAHELGRVAASIDEVRHHGHRVRSTVIRRLLKSGRVNLPRRMLGRPYEVIGTVMKGRGVGGELLVSTANLQLENAVIPSQGVYITLALVEGRWLPSATNIGTRPTFGDSSDVSIECHILDIQRDLLGHRLRVQFLHRLRDEIRFPDVAALKQQIFHDLQRTRRYFSSPTARHALGLA